MPEFINWKNLSFFGENKIINRSYVYLFIVPVLAKLLSKIQSPLNLNFGGENFSLVFELPFSWRMFFFSALLFTIASLLYNFFSPAIIKENKSYGDFLEHKKNFSHILKYLDNVGITNNWVKKQGFDLYEIKNADAIEYLLEGFKKYRIKFFNELAKRKLYVYSHTHSDMVNNPHTKIKNTYQEIAFWRLYDYANRSNPFWLVITVIIYTGGFSLIISVLVQSVKLVLNI